MNTGKLIGVIVAVVIIVTGCYAAFKDAVPTDYLEQLKEDPETAQFPVALDFVGGLECKVSGTNVTVTTPSVEVKSEMPQTIKDVSVKMYLGKGNMKYYLGTLDYGNIESHSKSSGSISCDVPAYIALGYLSNINTTNSSLPFAVDIVFKYLEWNGKELIDLGFVYDIDSPMKVDGKITCSYNAGTNTASMDLTVTEGFMYEMAKNMLGGSTSKTLNITSDCGLKLKVELKNNGSNKIEITYNATGTGGKPSEMVQKAIDGGKDIVFVYNGEKSVLKNDQLSGFMNVLETIENGKIGVKQ